MALSSAQTLAAVDLGSNSFHMLVARVSDGHLHTIDRLREAVRLAAGLDAARQLSDDAQQRALACLERFGQRLRDLPPGAVRAVGTNTLRLALNAGDFLQRADTLLGHPIEIISGIEEARLIYLGVARSLAANGKRRLVIDIGGGSTEFIIGHGLNPQLKESLQIGCVSLSRTYFDGGKLNSKRMKRAIIAAQQELEPFERLFHRGGWEQAVGASGTLRAIARIVQAMGWNATGAITMESLERLVDATVAAETVERLRLPELSAERTPVFPGGLAILYATFKILNIDTMEVAEGALREGLLYDLSGRIHHDDIRAESVSQLATRFHADPQHAQRVAATAHYALAQIRDSLGSLADTVADWLTWAARLHEIGLDIAHGHYHRHSAYVVEHADLAGFSQQDQKLLAALVMGHRRKLPLREFRELPAPWNATVVPTALLLRLSCLLHRNRHADPLPQFQIRLTAERMELLFPDGWLGSRPLTVADLDSEAEQLKAVNINLVYR